MRNLCFVVAHNESGKFLSSWLKHYSGMFDACHVYDDRSTDCTQQMFRDAGWEVTVRREHACSFLEHEGLFRQDAWDAAANVLEACEGDRVFVPDCDEFFVFDDDYRTFLGEGCVYDVRIDEIWGLEPIRVRVDGGWRNHGPRIAVFEDGARFRDTKCGPGSTPLSDAPVVVDDRVRVLHYGYCVPGAPQLKFERYSDPVSNRHSPAHIASIVGPPVLEEYNFDCPNVHLGVQQ